LSKEARVSVAQVLEMGRELLFTALLLALPTLVVSLVVGLTISIFQTITSIQEQTLSFIPRLVAVGLIIVVTMPWAIQVAVRFTVRMLWQAAEVSQ
jgi:flagellar biosynthesis protein FliQ